MASLGIVTPRGAVGNHANGVGGSTCRSAAQSEREERGQELPPARFLITSRVFVLEQQARRRSVDRMNGGPHQPRIFGLDVFAGGRMLGRAARCVQLNVAVRHARCSKSLELREKIGRTNMFSGEMTIGPRI